MNKVFMIGNLSKDVDLRTTQSGKAVASFTIAVNRRFKDKGGDPVTDFFPVVTWDKLAESCARYLAKGKKVAVVGELQTRSYEKDGVKRYVTEIVADEVEFLSPKETGAEPQSPAPDGFIDIQDEQLPF
jgi:single-strand DNA-binding protein